MPQREMTATRETEDAAEERAERVVEIEEQLAEAHREDRADGTIDSEVTIDLSQSQRTTARVLSIDKTRRRVKFTCFVDGEEQTFDVDWPSDTTDSSEPLVRLCRWAGVSVSRIGDLSELPVVETDRGRYGVYVPPGKRTTEVNVILPTDRTLSRRRTPLFDHGRAAVAWLALRATRTPLVGIESGRQPFDVKEKPALATIVIASLLPAAAIMATAPAMIVANPANALLAGLMLAMIFGMVNLLIAFVLGIATEEVGARVE